MTKGFFDKLPDVSQELESEKRYSQRSRQGSQQRLRSAGLSAEDSGNSNMNKSELNLNHKETLNQYLTLSANMTLNQGNIKMDSF